jgi:TatD DNase family protein
MTAPPATFFDTHVHLDLLPEHFDLREEVALAEREGICRFLVPGVEPSGWQRLLAVATSVPGGLAAPGVHPLAAHHWDEACRTNLKRMLEHSKVVAIGEIGLDGLLDFPTADIQEGAFRAQLRLARQAGVPVVLHSRKAAGRTVAILREEKATENGGIWHGFSGSRETAMEAIGLGFALAFGGPLTWPGARRAPEVLKGLPADWILLESDAPDLTPHPHRGEPNRPAYLALVAERMASLRGWSLEETARITTENACRILKISVNRKA